MMVSLGFPRGCDAQIGIKIMFKWILTTSLLQINNGGDDGGYGDQMKESIERTTAIFEENL